MNLFSWLNKHFGDVQEPVRTKIAIVKREASRLTLKEWQADVNLVRLAKKMLDNNDFRIMLDVVRNHHPINEVHFDISTEDRAIVQARCEGYTLCLNNLEALGISVHVMDLGEPTFEDPDREPLT